MEQPFILIMGVCGSGKTTVGRLLADRLTGTFIDADDFHPPANVKKLALGIALTDADREPWLDRLARAIGDHKRGTVLVVACSALKKAYRQRIGVDACHLVYLKGARAEIAARLQLRTDHFMSKELLSSQFDDLEEPAIALAVSIASPPDEIVQYIVDTLPTFVCE